MNLSDPHDAFERLAGHADNPSDADTDRLLTGVRRRERRRRATVRLTASGVAVALLVVIGVVILEQPSHRGTQIAATGAPFGTPLPAVSGPSAQGWAKGTWTALPQPPVAFGAASRAFWVDGRLVVVQPEHGDGFSAGPARWIGATYDPDTATWTKLPPTPAELGQGANVAAAADRLMLWGGVTTHQEGREFISDDVRVAFSLDPTSATWNRIAAAPPAATYAAVSTWTGKRLVVVSRESQTGARIINYDPSTDTWAEGDAESHDPEASASSMLWTGTDLLVWFDFTPPADGMGWQHLERYDPAADKWSRVSGDDERPAVADVAMVDGRVVGREVATPCGACTMFTQGRIVTIDPTSGQWSTLAAAPTSYLPAADQPREAENTPLDPGSRQLVIGGIPVRLALVGDPKQVEPRYLEARKPPMAAKAYDETLQRWVDAEGTAQPRHPIMRNDEGPFKGSPQLLWTGRSLVVWGPFHCIDTEGGSANCIHPTPTQGLLYTPEG